MGELEQVLDKLSDLHLEVSRLRRSLQQGSAPLGFGVKGEDYTYLFINPPSNPLTGNPDDRWYLRNKSEGVNRVVPYADLTAFVETLYRRDTTDRAGKARPRLEVHLRADRRYILQTGFYTNFSSSLLAALVELPREALLEPLTFLVEHTPGKNSHPTAWCQVEWQGARVERVADSSKNKAHLSILKERYGFSNPLGQGEGAEDE